jgi:DNA relaxase NicK
MKSLTVHNIDSDVARAIEAIAQSTGLSQNKVVKKLLRKALGLEKANTPRPDFSSFCGLWSKEEADAFDEAVKSFDQIDKGLWQ